MTDKIATEQARPDHERIFLEPDSDEAFVRNGGRMWCCEKIDDDWTEYVRADRYAALEAEADKLRKERDLYKAINNANPNLWFDQKATENEMFAVLQDTLCSIDALVDVGYVAEGTYPKLTAIVEKYTTIRNQALDSQVKLEVSHD